ncbi:MAG: single-stranded DNA-binding protein [Candidatus Zambryskibacteria bacterium RIFCSPHIGHO2_02_FULL_38_22]|uniref:Single-stranded DNA-binding protein n=1 Tax=Candidatus Zambryskibacteria bacterium RIFCSPLOWO2_12_FULL_39_16 TaxID=1802775 RepID=A0A1G2US99_9BACT|nr:MAG: single-stranded DNA-binding protein [Candidatus Zambryskibacteria bacterium RIFCSPHIGHO2_02_FULL_38_22]OHB08590.1 MAG: single-stranded DNA-binding protein [Candidatus Zambryskibacteria bacterium RIFCSPLOWO2_02_FULL_38_13]OHB12251.1 MAG: single-stranded DNA-binding protein [Candidatus Zambryskibacteria bacterium RIFCSPLOWO2_12_FULL_39_16]
MYINKAIIYGNLTRDPELKSLPSGAQVCEFGVATNRVWKDKNGAKQESVDYHNIVVFGRQAEIVKQYLHKGSGIFLEGRIQTRSWDAKDGTKRYRTEIVADRIQFGPKSGGGGSYEQKASGDKPKEKDLSAQTGEAPAIEYPEEEINSEDIPF